MPASTESVLKSIMEQFESAIAGIYEKRRILREQILESTKDLSDETKKQISESLGEFGTESDSQKRMERFVARIIPDFIANMETCLCGGDSRVHECLWNIGEEPLLHIEEALNAKGEKKLLESLKQFVFVFDDIARLDDREIQKILREVDMAYLIKALLLSPEDVRNKIYRNMSSRAANDIREDLKIIENLPRSESFYSRRMVISLVSRLADSDEIVIPRFYSSDLSMEDDMLGSLDDVDGMDGVEIEDDSIY